MDIEEEKNRTLDIVKKHAAMLSEHFDTVQIFCSKHDMKNVDGTAGIVWGTGNWFARYGHIKEWMIKTKRITENETDRDA